MKFAIITFLHTDSDTLLYNTIKNTLNSDVEYIRHTQTCLKEYDVILIPGSSTGDTLQTHGQNIASNIIQAIKDAAWQGKPIIGIGDGFQVLIDAGLLSGALCIEDDPWHISRPTSIKVENNLTMFTKGYRKGAEIDISTASGRYYHADAYTLKTLMGLRQVVFTFQNTTAGSTENIAGIVNKGGNVLGMLPQPGENTDFLASEDGIRMLKSVKKSVCKSKSKAKRKDNKEDSARNGCIGGIVEFIVEVVLEAIFS